MCLHGVIWAPYLAGEHLASCAGQQAQWCIWSAAETRAWLYRGHLAAGKGDKYTVREFETVELQHEPILFLKGISTLLKAWACTIEQEKLFVPTVRATRPSWWWVLQLPHLYLSTSAGFLVRAMTIVLEKRNISHVSPLTCSSDLHWLLKEISHDSEIGASSKTPTSWEHCGYLCRGRKKNLKTSIGNVNPSPISVRASSALALFPAGAGSSERNRHLTDPSWGFWWDYTRNVL